MINPRVPHRVFQGRDSFGESQAVFAPVEEVFRRVPNVAYERIVRLRRSRVKDYSPVVGLGNVAPVPQSACHGGGTPTRTLDAKSLFC
jgi:hypothetical protein